MMQMQYSSHDAVHTVDVAVELRSSHKTTFVAKLYSRLTEARLTGTTKMSKINIKCKHKMPEVINRVVNSTVVVVQPHTLSRPRLTDASNKQAQSSSLDLTHCTDERQHAPVCNTQTIAFSVHVKKQRCKHSS